MTILQKQPKNKAASQWLMSRSRTARQWIVLSVASGFISGILLVIQAKFIAEIVHGAYIEKLPRNAFYFQFWGLSGVILIRSFLAWFREKAGFEAGAAVRREVRLALMQRITDLGPSFTAGQKSGALAASIMEQTEALHNFFAHYLPQMALAVLVPLAIVTAVFPVSWAAGGLLLASAPMIPMFMILVGMGAENAHQRHFRALGRMSGYFLDVLQGLPTLKLFNRSRAEKEKVAEVSRDFRKRTMSVLRIAFISSAVLEFFSSLSIALVAVYLGMRFLGYINFGSWGHPMTLFGGLFILLLAPDFYMPLRELGTHYHARAEAVGAAREIRKILSIPQPEQTHTRELEIVSSQPVHIECTDISFSYSKRRSSAVESLSLNLRTGEQTALVGTSGAGKTTFLNLLMGFLTPDAGEIQINNTLLSDIYPQSLHRHIGWTGQNPVLFHGTVRENILMGNPEASEAAVTEAARSAHVLDFTDRMPSGLDTPVGEQGNRLSKGQGQRIALARLFLKDAPILFLDEPTAGLDAGTEQIIMNALMHQGQGRLVLMLTHRLETLRRMDRILVMSEGRIIEQGKYDDLMKKKGAFYAFACQLHPLKENL